MAGPTPPTVDLETLARLRDALLRRAARDRDSLFGEVAREVLAGRTTLREAATGSAYTEAFTQGGARLVQSLRNRRSEEMDAEAAARGVAALADRLEREEAEAEEAAHTERAAAAADRRQADEDDAPRSVLQGPPKTEYGPNPRREGWRRRW